MQTYDLFMLAVLVGATIFGFWKGMAWQIASLAALVVSYFASLKFSDQLAPLATSMFGVQAPLNRCVAMLVIYIITSFIVWMLFRMVSGAIDKIRLESFDKQMGGTLGFAEGVCMCVIITFFVVMFWPAQREAIVASQSGHYIVVLLDKANSIFPPEIHQVVDPYLRQLQERLNPNFQPPAGQDVHQMWPGQTQTNAQQAPPPQQQPAWPSSSQQQQPAWPSASQSQPAWPTPSQQPPQASNQDPYRAQQEPNPYPGPYSAEVPTSREY
jgi:membrane protein required for colicin V production